MNGIIQISTYTLVPRSHTDVHPQFGSDNTFTTLFLLLFFKKNVNIKKHHSYIVELLCSNFNFQFEFKIRCGRLQNIPKITF